jgi:ribosomal protein S27AE
MKNEGKKWTNEEVNFLKNNYPNYGSAYCANFLERNRKAVIKRAKVLKIKFGGISFKYLKENLEKIVKESKNVSDIVRKLGLKAAGGNHKTIMNYIKKYNIDITHFETPAERMMKIENKFVLTPLIQILVENSSYSRTHLKVRLYRDGLKKRECEECGQGEIWRGKKMSLILDHKNGVNNDNRLENLRIVCPNCNATLDTHGGKNNKKSIKKTKELKNKLQGKNNKRTNGIDGRKRAGIEKRVIVRPSHFQLTHEIQDFGYSATGRKYGVSDNAIKKWIKSYEKYGV